MKHVNRNKLSTLTLKLVNIALLVGLMSGSGAILAHEADKPAAADQKPTSATADESAAASLAEKATDPTALLMQLRLQDSFFASYHNADSYGNAALFQAVLPAKLGWGSAAEAIINRWTMPYVTTPRIAGVSDDGRSVGFGDSVLNTFFVTSWLPKGQKLAWGPTITVPTAGDNEFTGAGSWQAGPVVAFVNTNTPSWQWGAMAYQQWSFNKTRKNAENVSILSLQPIITKHFSGGWYISAPDTPNTYDFKNKRWNLNLGAVVGRVTKWGPQPIQLFGGVYFNPVSYDDVPSAKVTIKFNISFLMPTG